MAAPSFQGESETTNWTTSGISKTVSFAAQAGDILVVFGATGDQSDSLSISASPAVTFGPAKQTVSVSQRCWNSVWVGVAPSTNTFTITLTLGGGVDDVFGALLLVFRSSDGVGNSGQNNSAAGVATVAITTTQDNSAVCFLQADWDGTDDTSRGFLSVNGAFIEQARDRSAGTITVNGGYYADVGAAGAKTVGMTGPSMRFAATAVEIKGSAGGGGAPVSSPQLAVIGVGN